MLGAGLSDLTWLWNVWAETAEVWECFSAGLWRGMRSLGRSCLARMIGRCVYSIIWDLENVERSK